MIGEQIKTLRKQNSIDQKSLAKLLNIKQASLSDYENNKTNTPDDVKFKICEIFNINFDWLMKGFGDSQGNTKVTVPVLASKITSFSNIKDQANVINYIDADRYLFGNYNVRAMIDNALIITVKGDSMSPTFLNGDYAVFILNLIDVDGLYVISINGNLMVKRLQFVNNKKVIILSDSSLYKDEVVDRGENELNYANFAIVGKVITGLRYFI